jgi:hypothetical protein
MKRLFLYLLPLLLLPLACSKSKEKVLFPTKLIVGDTEYNFLYNPNSRNRIYSVTTKQANLYAAITFRYYDEYFRKPDHNFRDEIIEINYEPDRDVTGWDGRDSVISKSTLLQKGDDTLIIAESQFAIVFNKFGHGEDKRESYSDEVKHLYNANKQLTESSYYRRDDSYASTDTLGVLTSRVTYGYSQDKLAKASFYAAGADKPYLQIELAYDDKPGYLRNLPLEARFLSLELPYRDHNIVSYKVIDAQDRIRKDLSYTCTYTYNQDGYPDTFTRKMFDGRKVKGYMVYRTETRDLKEIASAQ